MARTKLNRAQQTYGLVRHRQGGTTGDGSWYTGGTSNTDVSEKGVFIQVGSTEYDGVGGDVVTFPTAFSQIPVVVATSTTAVTANTFARISDVTTTTFTFQCITDAGSADAERICWIAIGQ